MREIVTQSGTTREHHLLDVSAQASLAKCPVTPALAMDGTPTTSTVVVSYTLEARMTPWRSEADGDPLAWAEAVIAASLSGSSV
jgi:hypothetical protein